jgi:hypothetical protein
MDNQNWPLTDAILNGKPKLKNFLGSVVVSGD